MPGLGTTYGRGGATTAPKDMLNSDAILIMGSNMAENHPVAFQWIMEAKEKGTTVIHVDPRFNRTSAVANMWLPLRAGSDIIFLGGLIRHVLENDLFFREYLLHYTNAPLIISEAFRDTEELEGVFSGWKPEQNCYDSKTWWYEGADQRGGQVPGGRLLPTPFPTSTPTRRTTRSKTPGASFSCSSVTSRATRRSW